MSPSLQSRLTIASVITGLAVAIASPAAAGGSHGGCKPASHVKQAPQRAMMMKHPGGAMTMDPKHHAMMMKHHAMMAGNKMAGHGGSDHMKHMQQMHKKMHGSAMGGGAMKMDAKHQAMMKKHAVMMGGHKMMAAKQPMHAATMTARAKGPGQCGTNMYWKAGSCKDARAKS